MRQIPDCFLDEKLQERQITQNILKIVPEMISLLQNGILDKLYREEYEMGIVDCQTFYFVVE